MLFKLISLQRIKSESHRALAAHWDRLAAGRRFPAFTEFTPEPGAHDPKQLVVWNIEGERRQLKFRALYQGENVTEVFDSTWVGKTMDQVVPMSLRRITLDPARECVSSGCLTYTIVSTIDTNERRVDCERLLLPFGRDGSKVEQILASLELTGVPGGVLLRNILNNFRMQADLLFSGKIRSGFTGTRSASTVPTVEAHADAAGARPAPSLSVSNIAPTPCGRAASATGEHRRATRRNVSRAGRISFGKESMTCLVRNLSASGASIEGTRLIQAPDRFRLVLEMESTERRCTVVWRKKARIGVRFG
jgi:PilZ domain